VHWLTIVASLTLVSTFVSPVIAKTQSVDKDYSGEDLLIGNGSENRYFISAGEDRGIYDIVFDLEDREREHCGALW